MINGDDNNDNFEIPVAQEQQMRAENFTHPWIGKIHDVQSKVLPFGKRYVLYFEGRTDFLVLSDMMMTAIAQGVGSNRRFDWRGAEIELTPIPWRNRDGVEKYVFNARVVRAPLPESWRVQSAQSQQE